MSESFPNNVDLAIERTVSSFTEAVSSEATGLSLIGLTVMVTVVVLVSVPSETL